jgi:ribonuclease P protein component
MLPRAARLRRDSDFRAVYRRAHVTRGPSLTLHLRWVSEREMVSGRSPIRLGFVISKKTAKRAHDRNHLKRRLREICRTLILPRLQTPRPFDAFFVVNPVALTQTYAQMAEEVGILVQQAGLSIRSE